MFSSQLHFIIKPDSLILKHFIFIRLDGSTATAESIRGSFEAINEFTVSCINFAKFDISCKKEKKRRKEMMRDEGEKKES